MLLTETGTGNFYNGSTMWSSTRMDEDKKGDSEDMQSCDEDMDNLGYDCTTNTLLQYRTQVKFASGIYPCAAFLFIESCPSLSSQL